MDAEATSIVAFAAGGWLGSMFVVSSGLKLARYDGARAAVDRYRILPGRGAAAVGYALPWIELLAGCLVLTGVAHPAGALLASALGAVFAGAAVVVLRRGADVPCGCAGDETDRVGRTTVARGLAIVAGGLLLAIGGHRVGLPEPAAAALVAFCLGPGALVAGRRLREVARTRPAADVDAEVAHSRRVLTAPPG